MERRRSSALSSLFLFPPTGCGKTSLVQALVQGSAPARPLPTVACSVQVKVRMKGGEKKRRFPHSLFLPKCDVEQLTTFFFFSFFNLLFFFSSSTAPPTTPPSRASSSSSSGTSEAAGGPPLCENSSTATPRACCCATTCPGAAAASASAAALSAHCSLAEEKEGEGTRPQGKELVLLLRRRPRRPRRRRQQAGQRGSTSGPGLPRWRRRARSARRWRRFPPQPPLLPLPPLLLLRRRSCTLRAIQEEEHQGCNRLLLCCPCRRCWWGRRRTRTRHGGELCLFEVFVFSLSCSSSSSFTQPHSLFLSLSLSPSLPPSYQANKAAPHGQRRRHRGPRAHPLDLAAARRQGRSRGRGLCCRVSPSSPGGEQQQQQQQQWRFDFFVTVDPDLGGLWRRRRRGL